MHTIQAVYFQLQQHGETETKLKVKQAFQWMPEIETTFWTLKEALCTARILAYLQSRERFTTDTNASNPRFGEVLSQVYRVNKIE